MSAARDSAFADVKTFWIRAPSRTPNMFTMARKKTMTIAVRLAVLTPISMFAEHHGANRERRNVSDVPQPMGRRDRREEHAKNLPKATQTAAMVIQSE